MKNILLQILAYLLHHANREYVDDRFYKIKDVILSKYGKHLGYDVQFIEGKKCRCGDGKHHYHYDGYWQWDWCWHPYQRSFTKPETVNPIIDGYIEHTRSKYGYLALTLLFLIYEKGWLKRWYRSAGAGWYCSWYYPRYIPHNIVHLIKKRSNAIPIRSMRDQMHAASVYWSNTNPLAQPMYASVDPMEPDDLPF